jgi:molybdenum cofactor synthesis domain-containing protein
MMMFSSIAEILYSKPMPKSRSTSHRVVHARSSRKQSTMSDAASFTAAVLTISDSCARGERRDVSGSDVAKVLAKAGFEVTQTGVVPDDSEQIRQSLLDLVATARFVVTTGGTGISPRDVTPEATRAICDRLLDGVAERMRIEGSKKTSFAALSRGVCGVLGTTLILNLPGSPRGAVESLSAVIDLIPHALNLLEGKTEHS